MFSLVRAGRTEGKIHSKYEKMETFIFHINLNAVLRTQHNNQHYSEFSKTFKEEIKMLFGYGNQSNMSPLVFKKVVLN